MSAETAHGTYTAYKHGCRCEECREYQNKRNRRNRRNRIEAARKEERQWIATASRSES